MIEPLFLGAVVAIVSLAGTLLAQDIKAWRHHERRLERCPSRVR